MSTINLKPTSESRTYNSWSSYGSWPADIQSYDGDSTFEYVDRSVGGYESAQVDNLPAAAGTINSVVSHAYARRSGTGTNGYFRQGLRYGSNALGVNNVPTDAYVDYSTTHALAPGGGSWTPAKINSTQVLFYHDGTGSGNTVRCTYAYIYVNYTLAPGNPVKAAWVLPLIGIMSEAAHWLKLMRTIRAKEVGHWFSDLTLDALDIEFLKKDFAHQEYVCLSM